MYALSGKVRKRFNILMDPLSIEGQGNLEQIGIGLSAILHGPRGLGMGIPRGIPEWNTDMLLASLGHELGLWHIISILASTAIIVGAVGGVVINDGDQCNQLVIHDQIGRAHV